jgi:hypothetical protein
MGPAVAALENRGISTRVGDINRRINDANERYMDRQIALEVERLEVTVEIERIRKEALAQPSTSGTLKIVESSTEIATRADKESSRFSTGMAASIGDQYKAKLFLKTWNVDIDLSILKQLKWVDVDTRSITLKTGEQVVDKGDSVSLSKGSDDAIKAAVSMAKAKGWENVRVVGSEDFQTRAALALKDAGIEPRFASEAAKERCSDEMKKRQDPSIPELALKSDSVLEPKSEPPPESKPESVDFRTLEDRVLVAMQKYPLKAARHVKRDAKVLIDYASKIWADIDGDNSPEELGKIFQKTLKQHAIVEGYSDEDLRSAQLMSHVSDLPDFGTDLNRTRTPDLSRRKCYPDAGYKPPGT